MNLRKYLARIKRRLLKKPYLKDPKFAPYWFAHLLANEETFVLQIGSNDGKTGDPLYNLLMKNRQWKALFVEPVPYIFEKLVKNYTGDSRFKFENVAINNGKNLDFYWVDPKAKDELDSLPFWYDQLGSFNRNHISEELGDRIEPYVLCDKLEGITLPSLLKRNKVDTIDILHIDTEGYDWKILSQLDLSKYHPKFILFEKNHLSTDEKRQLKMFLAEDYLLFSIGIDGFAVSTQEDPEILAEMKRNFQAFEE